MYKFLVLLVSVVCAPVAAANDPMTLINDLKAQMQQLKSDYEKRIEELEQRLSAAEQQLENQQTVSQTKPQVSPPRATRTSRGNEFNPAIGLILDGKYRDFKRNPEDYAIPGFPLGGEAGPGEEGISLGESELNLNATVDDWFFGNLTVALADEGGETEVELEEAYIQSLSLPAGLTLRAGRYFPAVGYINEFHPHAWDFADAPLTSRAFLARQLTEDGVQVRWLAPTDLYLEFGGEALRGQSYPAAGAANDGTGAYNLFARLGGDVGASHSWRFGLSYLDADAEDRGGEEGGFTFEGISDLFALDFVWKWAPQGNPKERNLKFVAEYMRRNEEGVIATDNGQSSYDGTQDGWYAQAVYQFKPRWRLGVRYDQLSADNAGSNPAILGEAGLLDMGHKPKRYSVMADYSHTEFSRFRLQFNRDESTLESDNQWILQYIMNLGAHGGHKF